MKFDISAELMDSQAIQNQLEAAMGRGDVAGSAPPPAGGMPGGGMGMGMGVGGQ